MGKIMSLIDHIVNKFMKKKYRRSIEGIQRPIVPGAAPCLDESAEEEKDAPPLTPALAWSMAHLRASTPIRTRGTLVFEEEALEEDAQFAHERRASQAEDCFEWDQHNSPAHDIPVDSPEQFMMDGGDDSSSVYFEDEEKGETREKDCTSSLADFVLDDEYEDDGFDAIAAQQASFPAQPQLEEKYVFHQITWKMDDEGYEWVEPKGYSSPIDAPSAPVHLSFPALCGLDEKSVTDMARSAIEEDQNELDRRKGTMEWSPPVAKSGQKVDASVSPSARPGTPTTNGEMTQSSAAPCKLTRPECAQDDDNEWLRSLYEKIGIPSEIPTWMRVDPPTKEESPVMGGVAAGWATSTPEFIQSIQSPVFSSISTIGRLNDSASSTLNGSLFNGSFLGGKLYTLDVSVRERAALARPMADYLKTTFGCEDDN